jgi:hypothetical protein
MIPGGMIYIATSDQPLARLVRKPTEEDPKTTKEHQAVDEKKMVHNDSSNSSSWSWGSLDWNSCDGGSLD